MRRLVALIVVLVLTLALTAPPADAYRRGGHVAGHVFLGLAAFGLFNALVAPFVYYPRPVYAYPAYPYEPVYAPAYAPSYAPAYAPAYVERPVVVERQVYVSTPPPASSAPYPYASQVAATPPAPPASHPTVVQYAHGRYELRGDGVQSAYQWVWVPAMPPPPPPPPAAPPTRY